MSGENNYDMGKESGPDYNRFLSPESLPASFNPAGTYEPSTPPRFSRNAGTGVVRKRSTIDRIYDGQGALDKRPTGGYWLNSWKPRAVARSTRRKRRNSQAVRNFMFKILADKILVSVVSQGTA
jgi:hypothetical protein